MTDGTYYTPVIPANLMADPEIKFSAKCVYAIISSFRGRGCWYSNPHLAEICGIAEPTTVSRLISSLVKKGYVTIQHAENGYRILYAVADIGGEEEAPEPATPFEGFENF